MLKSIKHLLATLCLAFSPALASSQSEPLHVIKDSPVAADFSLQDLDGQVHRLSAYKGRVVIINFWASWCPPCREEMPSMEKAYQTLKTEGVVMLAINVGEDDDTIFSFTADYPVTFPLLMDHDSRVTKNYPVVGLPTSFVIDPRGRMVYRVVGTREWTDKDLLRKIISLK